MSSVYLHGKKFDVFLPREEILIRVQMLADKLNLHYQEVTSPPLIIGILNGSFVFMADLVRMLHFPCTVQFIRIESYQGLQSSGLVKMESDVSQKWAGKHLIVVEDIVDTGNTMNRFLHTLQGYQPLSVFIASLLFKRAALVNQIQLDHFCFEIPTDFVVGYGLDFDGLGRNLPDIYRLSE